MQGSPGSFFFTSPKAEAAWRENSREGNGRLSEMAQSELMQWGRVTLDPLGSTGRPRPGLSILWGSVIVFS